MYMCIFVCGCAYE